MGTGEWAGLLGIAGLVSIATAWGAYWKSDAIALRMSRAVEADPVEYARLHNLVEGLCIAGGLSKPRLYVIDDASPSSRPTPVTASAEASPRRGRASRATTGHRPSPGHERVKHEVHPFVVEGSH